MPHAPWWVQTTGAAAALLKQVLPLYALCAGSCAAACRHDYLLHRLHLPVPLSGGTFEHSTPQRAAACPRLVGDTHSVAVLRCSMSTHTCQRGMLVCLLQVAVLHPSDEERVHAAKGVADMPLLWWSAGINTCLCLLWATACPLWGCPGRSCRSRCSNCRPHLLQGAVFCIRLSCR